MSLIAGLVITGPRMSAQDPKETGDSAETSEFIEFVRIVPGGFVMGCDFSSGTEECFDPYRPEGWEDSRPEHFVTISTAFEIGKYEVTQLQWKTVMGANPSHFQDERGPVESIGWEEVQDFLAKMNARSDGYHYRLPTEAEWEYAARAGAVNGTANTGSYRPLDYDVHGHLTSFWFGIHIDGPVRNGTLDDLAWYSGNSGGQTHPVGQKLPNAWGLFDMLGNVRELVQDFYRADYYGKSPASDPMNNDGSHHLARGGSWDVGNSIVRVWARHGGPTSSENKNSFTGLRLVRVKELP